MDENTQAVGWQARGSRNIIEGREELPIVVLRRDLEALPEIFEGRRLAVARSIYLAFVERIAAGDGECTRKELANDAGVTTKTLDEYVPEFIAAGIVERTHRFADGVNLPNVWRVRSPGGGARSVPTHADHPQQSSSTTSVEVKKKDGGGPATLPPANGVEIPDALRADAVELLRRKTKVDGKVVNVDEMVIATAAIAEINRQADADFGVGAHLRAIVMRVRERPSYTPDAHVRLVQSAWRLRWWERNGRRGRRATPAVVYGNAGVFEQVVQDAVDEKKGRERVAVEPDANARSRFDRED